MNLIRRLFGRKPEATAGAPEAPSTPSPVAPTEARKRIRPDVLARFGPRKAVAVSRPFDIPTDLHPPSVGGAAPAMAQDSAFGVASSWAGNYAGVGLSGATFRGFPVLAELAQIPEYRKVSEAFASEMTRAWIELQVSGTDDDKSEKIAAINDEMDRLKVRDVVCLAVEQDGLFGRGHIFVDLGSLDPDELRTNIGNGSDDASKEKVGRGKLKGFRTVEAIWTYPAGYEAANPLSPNSYQPTMWNVMGRPVHTSRLLTIVGRPVPDLLKPVYSFGGISRSQLIETAVENFLRIRRNVADLIESFNTYVLKTAMGDILTGGSGDVLADRIDMFTRTKDNFGVLAIDQLSEAFENLTVQLAGLDKLQAQALEQICVVAKMPLIKFTGIGPSGLNASSEGEIRSFGDDIHAEQERVLRRLLTTIIDLIQLSLFGEVDKSITFRFIHLWSLSEKELADIREVNARTDGSLITAGVIRKSESRQRVASDPGTPYNGLDAEDLPPLTIEEAARLADVKLAAASEGILGDQAVLQGLSDTGIFPEITAEMIAQADTDPPVPTELGGGGEGGAQASEPAPIDTAAPSFFGKGRADEGDGGKHGPDLPR